MTLPLESPPPRACDLATYREALGPLPAPTAEQVESFIEFFIEARSWYKHLPLTFPGSHFMFLLDPFAGQGRTRERDGSYTHTPQIERPDFAHYTWMPTTEYLSRHGHLAYCRWSGKNPPGMIFESGVYVVPPELLASSVELT